MIRVEEQKKWVTGIIAALTEERQLRYPNDLLSKAVPTASEALQVEIGELNKALDNVEERIYQIRRSLEELEDIFNSPWPPRAHVKKTIAVQEEGHINVL